MVWLVGYFDAGGHADGKHVLTVGGYVSQVRTWERLELHWNKLLKQHDIDVFHATDFMARQGDFENWQGRDQEHADLLWELVSLTRKNVHKSLATQILLADWRKANQEYKLKESHCTPYGLSGFFTMHRGMKFLGGRKKNSMMRCVFEDGDKGKGDFIWMVDQIVNKNKRLLKSVKPNFESKKLAPLQASDLVLWEMNHLSVDQLKNPPEKFAPLRESFEELLKIPRDWGVIDYEKLIKFCGDFDVPKRGESRTWTGPARGVSVRQGRA